MKDFTRKRAGEQSQRNMLTIRGLRVRFGGLTAIDGMDFSIDNPGIRGLIGPNGAGKTTFFNAITGFVKAEAGEVVYQGEHILGSPAHAIAKRGIIRTFQNSGVFPEMSVLENVMTGYHRRSSSTIPGIILGWRKARQEEREIIDRAMVHLETIGLGGVAEQRAGDLSYGQQRIVEIARALFSGPKILFLDEPGAGLSATEKSSLVDFLQEAGRRETRHIVVTDHSMDFIMTICDFITVMNLGKKLFEGTPEEIQNSAEVIDAYLGKE